MNKKGFTLVELVAVITILGVILIIAVPSYSGHVQKSKLRKCEADERSIKDATNAYITYRIRKNEEITEEISINVSNLTGSNRFLDDDYSRYNDIKIIIKPTASNGVNDYAIEIDSSSKSNFNTICGAKHFT